MSNIEKATSSEKNVVRKQGKTLILKSNKHSFDLSTLPYDEFEGLEEKNESRSGCVFLVFSDVEKAGSVWKRLREEYSEDVLSKFAHYKLFFKISNLEDTSDYDKIKEKITSWVLEKTSSNVLYFKLYRKNNQYLGCGDLTLDTKEGMDCLLNKDKLKEWCIEDTEYSGVFYRYDNRRRRNPQQQQQTNYNKA